MKHETSGPPIGAITKDASPLAVLGAWALCAGMFAVIYPWLCFMIWWHAIENKLWPDLIGGKVPR